MSHAELAKQIADGVIDGKPFDTQQGMQRLVAAQQGCMGKAFGAHQNRQKVMNVVLGSIWLGDFHWIGMCCRNCPTRSILRRKETRAATPPKGVTARLVWRRISRSLDSRAANFPQN